MTLGPTLCRIGITPGHSVLHVEVWHPNWGTGATEALRRSLFGADGTDSAGGSATPDIAVARELLDAALGADRAAAWLGRVAVTDRSPDDAVGMPELQERVARMAQDALDPDGRPVRTLLHVDRDGVPGTARVIMPLSPVVAPGCDLHVSVTLRAEPVASSDLTMAQIEDLAAGVEDALVATVEENGAGVLAVTETVPGQVTLHFYLDSSAPTVVDRSVLNTLRTVASTWDLGDTGVEEEPDPNWEGVQAYRV